MFLGHKINDPKRATRAGLALFVLANLATLFLHSSSHLARGATDGIKGLLYGLSIGLLLLSLRLRNKTSSRA